MPYDVPLTRETVDFLASMMEQLVLKRDIPYMASAAETYYNIWIELVGVLETQFPDPPKESAQISTEE